MYASPRIDEMNYDQPDISEFRDNSEQPGKCSSEEESGGDDGQCACAFVGHVENDLRQPGHERDHDVAIDVELVELIIDHVIEETVESHEKYELVT